MAKIGTLTAYLVADTAKFSSGLSQAQRNMNSSAAAINRGIAGIEVSFSRLKSTLAGVAGGLSLARLASEIVDAGLKFDRLNTRLQFSAGSATAAAQQYQYLLGFANKLGLSFDATADAFASFAAAAKGTSIEGDQTRVIFEAVAKAATALKLSADDTSGVFLALSQIISKGTVQAEELRGQLGERLPGAFQIAARAMGVTTAQLGKMLQSGQVIASDFLPKFAAEMEKSFGKAAEDASDTAVAAINRLENSWGQLLRTLSNSKLIEAGATGLASFLDTLKALDEWSVKIGVEPRLERLNSTIKDLEDANRDLANNLSNQDSEFVSRVRAEMDINNRELEQAKSEREKIFKQFFPEDRGEMGRRGLLPLPATLEGNTNTPPANTKKTAAERNIDRMQAKVASLQAELDQLNTDSLEGDIEKNLLGFDLLTPQAKELANAIAILTGEINNQKQAAKDDAQNVAEIDQIIADATERVNQKQQEAKDLMESLRTPTEVYADTVSHLNQLLNEGSIDADTWSRGLDQAKKTLASAQVGANNFSDAMTDLGSSWSSAFEDAALSMDDAEFSAKSLGDTLKGLAQDIERVLLRLSVEDPLINGVKGINWASLFGSGLNANGFRATGAGPGASANTSTGGFFDFLSNLFHTGGIAGGPAASRRVPSLMFAGAPRLHSGGFIGPGEVPAILKRGEGVFTPEQMAAMGTGRGGEMKVVVNNYSGQQVQAKQTTGVDGMKQLEIQIGDSVARNIRNNGSVAKAMSQRFGLTGVAGVQRS
jgi:tape measure domain-containing protein